MKKANVQKPSYPTVSEFRGRELLKMAALVGIGVTAATVPFSVISEEKPSTESKKAEDVDQKIKDQIILLTANLGHDNFKEREKATATLISMGEKFVKEKKNGMASFIKEELEKGKKSKDPEVKERAKKILLAVTPPPPKIPTDRLDGDIAIAGDIDF